MNPYAKYSQQEETAWTRIDMLLALYDGTIQRLQKAMEMLRRGEREAAEPILLHAQLLVGELAAGVVPDETELTTSILRLHEFAMHALKTGSVADVEGVLSVLCTLRESFEAIRDEAARLERSGAIPPLNGSPMFQATA